MTRTTIKLDLDVSELVSNAGRARGAISTLTEEMKKAEKEKRWDDYSRLQVQRDTLTANAANFKKDTQSLFSDPRYHTQTSTGGLGTIKMDPEQALKFRDLTDAIKKLTVKYDEQLGKGELTEAGETFTQLQKKYGEYHKEFNAATAPAGDRSAKDMIKAIGIGNIANAINEGFSRWVGSLDRSSIVSQYGSGDIWGARISEKRRQANLVGGITQAGLTVLGTGVGFFLGGPGGAMLGGTLGGAGGNAINNALNIAPNKEATEAAYAGLWQQRSADAMQLAALSGDPQMIRQAFREAADAAAKFGYSAEEGMEAIKQAAQQGLDGEKAKQVTEQIFSYERSTGAERGTLAGISTMAARYGAGDALGVGWAGLQASGMKPGQYNEYLRAMQRVMEDAIKNGFTRSAEDVAKNLAMLAQMTGNDPLWQGEQGAQRLSEMNSGLAGATGLQSSSDIIAFRAARNISGGGSYIEAMKVLEKGLTPELFSEYMRLASSAEGGGREGIVERMRQTFGLNYISADKLYEIWKNKPELTQVELDQYKNTPLPSVASPELDAAKTTEAIKNWWTESGMVYWDKKLPELSQELAKAVLEHRDLKNPGDADTRWLSPEERVLKTQQNLELARATGDKTRIEWAEIELHNANQIAGDPNLATVLKMDWLNGRMEDLMKTGMPWDKNKAALFTGDGNPFTKNDDEKAFDRFAAYVYQPEAHDNLAKGLDILNSLTPEQRNRLNESNDINREIPDVMTDKTGQQLLGALERLANMTLTFEERP